MQHLTPTSSATSKVELYQEICSQLQELLGDEPNLIANAANTAALLYHSLPDVSWAGFYFAQRKELVLGPFQGKPACVRIRFGEGVCGTAAKTRESIIVPDVNEFPGHIACDTASRSEIVIPLLNWGKFLGVLDIDSPSVGRFDDEDREGLESVAAVFLSGQVTEDLPDLAGDSSDI
jgi:L-methionine (R)-S-oxide reductase